MKIVINVCYGGFGLSDQALQEYKSRKGTTEDIGDWDIPRDDPVLVSVVEDLGEKSHGNFAILKVVDIPDDVKWEINEYDGNEWVAEVHRIWQ